MSFAILIKFYLVMTSDWWRLFRLRKYPEIDWGLG